MADRFMDRIDRKFKLVEDKAPWADQVQVQLRQFRMDAGFLKMFRFCLKIWDWDEQRSRSMINHLRMLWTKEHKGRPSILSRLTETWPVDVQHFQSLSFEMEGIIHQTKLQIENLLQQSIIQSLMQCKSSSTFYNFNAMQFLSFIKRNIIQYLDLSNCRDLEIVYPFIKHVDFLKQKIEYLDHRTDEKEVLQFMNFVQAFANSVAFLTCLHWAREEANEEEMNILLFHMLQKFTPFAPDIIPLYIRILDLQESDPIPLGEAVASFIDFLFEYLAIVLEYDDYLILRDKLIFLFTFLAGPPHVGVGVDSIRSQIDDLFHHEDSYLLLPFDEMKRDFSDKKMHPLSDVMIKIETATTKIIQIYCGFSDSWSTLEAERIDCLYLVSIQRELSSIEKHAPWAHEVVGQLQLYKMELRFLKMFLRCFQTWDEEIKEKSSYIITYLQGIWGKNGLVAPRLHAIQQTGDISNWHLLASELQGKIQMSKQEIEAWWKNLSFRCKSSTSNKTLNKSLDSVLHNLNDIVSCRADKIVPFKNQIETLKEKLEVPQSFLKLTAKCIDNKELQEFRMFVQVLANDAACLTFLYWAQEEANDETVTETNLMLSHMLQKIKLGMPNVARLYFQTLKAIYMQRPDSLLFGQTAFSFIDLFIEDLVNSSKHDFQTLRDNIIFLLTFLNDPPNDNAAELVCSQMDVLFWEGVCGLLPFDDTKHDFFKKKVLLSDFVIKIQSVNVNIRQLYCKFPDSSLYNFPTVVAPRFLDFLIENLRNLIERMTIDRKYAPFAKHPIIQIEEELVSLRPLFNQIFMLQSELNATWLQVVNLIHLTEHVINSCISSWFVFDHPIWYHQAYLSEVFERIKVVKTELEYIIEKNTYNARCIPDSASFVSTNSEQSRSSETNELVVGFEDEAKKIIEKVTWGYKSLDVVSIVGMGGLGKTTIAKKIYGLVKCDFNIFAFCIVSQDHNTRRLLLDILHDIKGDDKKFSDMTDDEDLAHELRKNLSRQKYLIVLDDIWDISAWNKVRSSFPDHKNGSRVIFTTRSRKVAEKCKINCSPHYLRFMTEDESWELLQKRVFHNGISPPNLYDIGKLISKNCKGLPLAVAVIAGVLARTDQNQSSWREIAERLSSCLYDEGCMDILELSFKHLPEYLKPCLIYLGAYPQDSLMEVEEVILLWIAEGFVPESKIKRLEDVAKEYFHDLVDRSFVIVNSRGSGGEIKTFRVHDLIHDLCQRKCQDGNFFQLRHGIAATSSFDSSINKNYRVSMEITRDGIVDDGLLLSHTRSVICFNGVYTHFPFKDLKLAHVLQLKSIWVRNQIEELTSLVHVRHIEAEFLCLRSIPSSIANLWNIQSLILNSRRCKVIDLPETLWKMKSLRCVKVGAKGGWGGGCKVNFLYSDEHEICPQLDKVVRFSCPVLSTGKDVEQLLQRLPAVQKLSCFVKRSVDDDDDDESVDDNDEESVETLNFYRKLESLKLIGERRLVYLINFPSTLKKLTLKWIRLPWTAIPAIAELHCLRVLKLLFNSFPGTTLEMEEVAFQNLILFELYSRGLVEWNVATESFPCLEHLVIECNKLEELPPCFEEISSLKRIHVRYPTAKVEKSALEVGEQQMELGNKVEVLITKNTYKLDLAT